MSKILTCTLILNHISMLKNFILKTFLFAFCITLLFFHLSAQKKDFTEEQLLKNKMPLVVVPLPTIVSWNDDSHLILSRKVHADSLEHRFVFDLKTHKKRSGKRRIFVNSYTEENLLL